MNNVNKSGFGCPDMLPVKDNLLLLWCIKSPFWILQPQAEISEYCKVHFFVCIFRWKYVKTKQHLSYVTLLKQH